MNIVLVLAGGSHTYTKQQRLRDDGAYLRRVGLAGRRALCSKHPAKLGRIRVENDIDSMLQLWTPVARETSSGQALGSGESVSVEQALRAMTSNAAWQLRMEGQIGSIEAGKYADLVILSDNPLDYGGDHRDIQVECTVVGGVTIYDRTTP